MRVGIRASCWCLLLLVPLALGSAAAADESVVEEVLGILHQRGLVDDAEYARLQQKQASWKEANPAGPRIEWSGDLRARYEQYWFERDPLGEDRPDRSRGRYRLRLKGKATINERIAAVFRLSSGQGSARSGNQTLGVGDDFAPDDLFIDQAYLELTPPEGWIPGRSVARIGKMDVPFRWKQSPDSMLWDRDLQVEGVGLSWTSPDLGGVTPYARAAYLIADENGRSRDPHVLGLQLGLDAELAADWSAGGRIAHYEWRSVDPAFLGRAAGSGSLRFGLTDSVGGSTGLSVTELAAYLAYDGIEGWPLRAYGHVLRNHDAKRSPLHPGAGDEDMGLGVGVVVGDKRELVELGVGWFRMEANAWPGQFVDSPLFDGTTNREAVVVHAVREVLANTDLKVSLFFAEPDERSSTFAATNSGADRILLQADLMVRF